VSLSTHHNIRSHLFAPELLSMDHSQMDHGHMDHGDDGGDMDMGQCSMNVSTLPHSPSNAWRSRRPRLRIHQILTYQQMLFTWSSKNLCIIFPQWRVTGTLSLLISLLAIVILTAGYEWVRDLSRRYEQRHASHLQAFNTTTTTQSKSYSLHIPSHNRNILASELRPVRSRRRLEDK
jgi:solute carrier family 31 (copper transporter), member 1